MSQLLLGEWLTHVMHVAPKTFRLFWLYIYNKSNFQKIFEEEMLIEILSTNLLQLFFRFMLNAKGSFQKCLNDSYWGYLQA